MSVGATIQPKRQPASQPRRRSSLLDTPGCQICQYPTMGSAAELEVTDSTEPLKVTLVWNDYPSTPAAMSRLKLSRSATLMLAPSTPSFPKDSSV